MNLDDIDKNLISIIQAELPLHPEPFAVLAHQLNTNSKVVIHRIARLKEEGIIRQIGPVFNPRRLGYNTTLAAMRLTTRQLTEARHTMMEHPQVSHCYEREHDFNFWFTLALPAKDSLESKVQELGSRVKAEITLNLPAVKVFKIGAYFNPSNGKPSATDTSTQYPGHQERVAKLSTIERAIINELQQDLPLIERPFDLMSAKLLIQVDEFISHCQALLRRGIMRRYSGLINHNKLGFTANVMACWKVAPDIVELAGKKMATFPQVSHCYQRQTNPFWPYNLFAMIHAHTRDASQTIAKKVSAEAGLDENDMILLFTTREIKKTRIKYNP